MRSTLLFTCILLAPTCTGDALASDLKQINAAVCRPYTASDVDPALLRIRADGISNDYTTSKFVICPIHRDGNSDWDPDNYYRLWAMFRRNGGPSVTSNQCTLNLGGAVQIPLSSAARNAMPFEEVWGQTIPGGVEGVVEFDSDDLAIGDVPLTASLVCRIAPGHVLDSIAVMEEYAL